MRQLDFPGPASLDHHFRIDLCRSFNIGNGSRNVLFGQTNEILVARQENKILKIRKTFRNEGLFFGFKVLLFKYFFFRNH